MAKDLTKTEVRDIVKDEITKYISKELDREITALLKRGKSRDEVNQLIKNGLTSLYKYMWIRKDVWQNDIK